MSERFDVVVIGSGAGGGTLAHTLAATGARILIVERGDFIPQEDENWSPHANPRKASGNIYHLYWLYSVERAMDLVGHQKIGTHLWYSEMGQFLINRQLEDGAWDTHSGLDPRKVLDTSFALLFLKKATQGQIPFPSVTGGTDEPPVDNR